MNQQPSNIVTAMPKRLSAAITLSLINSLRPGDVCQDPKLPGFGVRRQKDAVSYFVKLRHNGRQRWITIGRHGMPGPTGMTWTPDTARARAKQLVGNPSLADKPVVAPITRFNEVADDFLTKHGIKLKPRTRVEYERLIRLYLKPAFGALVLDKITHAKVSDAHISWGGAPRSANFALTVMSKLMVWAKDHGLRAGDNPCSRVVRYKEKQRRRYLSITELMRLGEALDQAETAGQLTSHAVAAIRLLILTGARLSEILTLQWSFVDFERAMLFLPDSKTDQKTITLSDDAVAVLRRISRLHGNPYVIVGKLDGTHIANLHHAWNKVSKAAGISDVRLHDLRHTWASTAVAAGASLPIIGRQLGHATPRTTARYAHLSDDPLRQMAQLTGQKLAEAMRRKSE